MQSLTKTKNKNKKQNKTKIIQSNTDNVQN